MSTSKESFIMALPERTRADYVDMLVGSLSAPDRVIARAYMEGDDNFVQLSADLEVPVEDLAARWNLRILPSLRRAVAHSFRFESAGGVGMSADRSRPMTVGQMITALAELPADALLYVDGYEGGLHDAGWPGLVELFRNVNDEDYYGPHDTTHNGGARRGLPETGYRIGGVV